MSRQTLHLLTRPAEEFTRLMIREQDSQPGVVVVVRDLTATEPDYRQLLTDIFAADSVTVW